MNDWDGVGTNDWVGGHVDVRFAAVLTGLVALNADALLLIECVVSEVLLRGNGGGGGGGGGVVVSTGCG